MTRYPACSRTRSCFSHECPFSGVAVDQHDRLPLAVVLVVDLDVGAVLLADGDLCHCLAFLVVVMTVMRAGCPCQNPARGAGVFASVGSLARTLASRSGPGAGERRPRASCSPRRPTANIRRPASSERRYLLTVATRQCRGCG